MVSLYLHGLRQLVLPDTWPQHLRFHYQQYQLTCLDLPVHYVPFDVTRAAICLMQHLMRLQHHDMKPCFVFLDRGAKRGGQ